MSNFVKKLVNFTKNTTVRIISFLLVVAFIASIYFYPDFYKTQWHKIQGCYYVYLGDKAYEKGQAQEAINNYIRGLDLYPGHYKARYNLANLYVAYEDYYSALESYRIALELKPDFMIARINYAIVLAEVMFDYDRAIEEYDLAIKNKSKLPMIPYITGDKNTYNYNKSVAYYNQGLAWRGKSIRNGHDRFKYAEYLEKAIESYNKALDTRKTYDIYYNLGIANQLLKRNYAAGKNYCTAIKTEPKKFEAHYNLAILLKSMKKYKESIEEFKKAEILLGDAGDTTKIIYIYGVLNAITKQLANDPEYANMLFETDEEVSGGNISYIGKKLIVSEEFDKAMNKNFATCSNKDDFYKKENIDY